MIWMAVYLVVAAGSFGEFYLDFLIKFWPKAPKIVIFHKYYNYGNRAPSETPPISSSVPDLGSDVALLCELGGFGGGGGGSW